MMSSKLKTMPGPGHYDTTNTVLVRKPNGFPFTTVRRIHDKKLNTPGVGHYDIERYWKFKKDKTKGYSIGKNRRFKSLEVRVTRNVKTDPDHRAIIQMFSKLDIIFDYSTIYLSQFYILRRWVFYLKHLLKKYLKKLKT